MLFGEAHGESVLWSAASPESRYVLLGQQRGGVQSVNVGGDR